MTARASALCAAMLLTACTTTAPPPAPAPAPAALPEPRAAAAPVRVDITWDVTVKPGFVVDERVCWGDVPMVRVMPEARAALPYAGSVRDGAGRALAVGEDGVELAGLDERARRGCLTLSIDAGRAARELDDDDLAEVRGNALVASPDLWLWRPEPWPAGAAGELALHVPAGMQVSVPWPRVDDGRYRVDYATWKMMARCAFGPLDERDLDVGEARFSLARLPGTLRASDAGIARWLSAAAGAVSLVDGRFPVRHAQILLVPVDGGRSVPFGMAIRGGGPAAILLVSSRASDDALLGEWVAVHELSHLLIPPVKHDDSWLSEGLASYYQQILRGRAGLLSRADAWGGLVDGFDRGRAEAGGETLLAASARMHEEHAYVPVYWGGAAILFRLDVALREKGRSLDELVALVRQREPVDVTYRAADEIVGWWAAAAPDVDVRGIVAAGLTRPFPEVDDVLARIGVRRGRGERAVLDDNAPLAAVRTAIMSAPPPRHAGDNTGRNVLNSAR